jgi:hypothetical protein
MSTTKRGGHDGPGGKAVLVCRDCEREAHVDGDWAVTEYELGGDRHRVYQCPDCWHTLVVQPVFDDGVPVPA